MAQLGDFAVTATVLPSHETMDRVVRLLRDDPSCPGVVTEVYGVYYLLDRVRMDSWLSAGLGFKQSLLSHLPLISVIDGPALVLPADLPSDEAARAAMARPAEQKSVPAVVQFADGTLGVIPIGPLVEHLTSSYAELSRRDGLTGLGNRRLLRETLDELDANEPIALIALDLDRFKEINEELGHHGGDEVLRHVGKVLSEQGAGAFRLAGDEFVVLIERPEPDELRAYGEQLLAALRVPVVVEGVHVTVEASLGIAYGREPSELLAQADAAMDAAKRDRTTIEHWRPELATARQTDLRLLGELRDAIATGQLVLHYQPLVDRDGVARSVEALVRWQHPGRGLLTPAAFLPQAERSAVINDLTDRVLSDAIAQAARWHAAGLRLPVAVNLAAPVLAHGHFVGVIRDLLDEHGLPATALIVEVTESAVMTRPDRSARLLSAVRELGVRIAMDDFGTGYTSLALLTQLPLDELKLDRTFINGLHNERERVIVEAVARMAHGLGLTLVAEGVEDRRTADLLCDLGFDLLQGYFFGHPVPADRLPNERCVTTQLASVDADMTRTPEQAGHMGALWR